MVGVGNEYCIFVKYLQKTFVQLRVHFIGYFVVIILELDKGYWLSFYPRSKFF